MKVTAKVWHHSFDMKEMKPKTQYHEKEIEVPDKMLPHNFSTRLMEATIENRSLKKEFEFDLFSLNYDDRRALDAKMRELFGAEMLKSAANIIFEIKPGIYYAYQVKFVKSHDKLFFENELVEL